MAFVQGVVFKRIAPGQTLTIFGGFFDGSCSVYFGNKKASVVDYEESMIEVLAPLEKGEYKVTLNDGKKTHHVCEVSVVELDETPKRFSPKNYEKNDFFKYVLSLLPRGNAFAIWNGSSFNKLLTALADAFKYTWETIQAMVDSVDPTHTENFDDWENELNLPVLGIYPQTHEDRRAEIYRVECGNGGCSVEYMKHILFLMGIDADVYEYTKDPSKFTDVDFGDDDPRFFAMIEFHLLQNDFVQFRAGTSCAGECILDFGRYKEEAVFDKLKPSHIKFVYSYVNADANGLLVTSDGDRISTSSGDVLKFNL